MNQCISYEGCSVWVTGGLSGIGYSICQGFLKSGAHVYTNFVHEDSQHQDLYETLKLISPHIYARKVDVTDCAQISAYLSDIDQREGKLDILINNAAVSINDNFDNFDIKEYRRVLDVNLSGKVNCTAEAVPYLKKSSFPSVVNIASRLASRPQKDSLAYCCAAAGIVMFSKVAALELAEQHIRVNTVSPSLTVTPMSLKSYSLEEIEETRRQNPRGRLCSPDDVVQAILFLCSANASFINGANLDLNGGVF